MHKYYVPNKMGYQIFTKTSETKTLLNGLVVEEIDEKNRQSMNNSLKRSQNFQRT